MKERKLRYDTSNSRTAVLSFTRNTVVLQARFALEPGIAEGMAEVGFQCMFVPNR
jgi:hypothetical protein